MRPKSRKRVVVERRLDSEDLSLGELGRRIGDGVKQGAGFLGNLVAQIQDEFAKGRRPLTEEELIRQRIEKRYEARRGLLIHLAVYVFVNALLWILWATAPELISSIPEGATWEGRVWFEDMQDFIWPIFVTVPWMLGLIGHWINYHIQHGGGARRREREIQEAIQQSRQMRAYYEADYDAKRKRDAGQDDGRAVRLTADGELTESFAEQWDDARSRKRRR